MLPSFFSLLFCNLCQLLRRLKSLQFNKELQEFLRARGISTTGYTKARLVKLATAVSELNLPTDPDLAGPSHSVAGTLQAKLQRAGCNFSEPANLPGFSDSFAEFWTLDCTMFLIIL